MSQPQREIHKQRQTAPGVRQWTQCWRAKLATALHTFLNNRIIPIIRLQRPMRLLCGLSPNRGSGVHREIHSGLWAFKVVPANSAFPTLGFVAFLATKSPFASFLTQRPAVDLQLEATRYLGSGRITFTESPFAASVSVKWQDLHAEKTSTVLSSHPRTNRNPSLPALCPVTAGLGLSISREAGISPGSLTHAVPRPELVDLSITCLAR